MKKRLKKHSVFLFGVIIIIFCCTGTTTFRKPSVTIAFYNLENLFDTLDDKHKNDNEFLPTSAKNWNTEKYYMKLNKTARVILAMNDWSGPDIIGLCEAENETVLKDLVMQTTLLKYDYKYIHYESPDRRGIDNALLYKANKVKVVESYNFPADTAGKFKTRDILWVRLLSKKYKDTISVFVNHWPSRMGGKEKSTSKRLFVSSRLLYLSDSLKAEFPNDLFIALGDFNDDPEDESLQQLNRFYKYNPVAEQEQGTLKYQAHWNKFDQIMFDSEVEFQFEIYNPYWMYKDDERYAGEKPYRSYLGKKYIGGYSDHFPVLLFLK